MSTSSTIFQIALLISAFSCTLVFGKMLVFQTVVMPGLHKLDDAAYLRAFQVIDGIIQANEPVFVITWIGSVIALVGTAIYGVVLVSATDTNVISNGELAGLIAATVAYLICQFTTFTINVPLNNRVKVLDIPRLKDEEAALEREHFEPTWLKWHFRRTVLFGLVSIYLLVLLMVVD